jgi:hypothetical protein
MRAREYNIALAVGMLLVLPSALAAGAVAGAASRHVRVPVWVEDPVAGGRPAFQVTVNGKIVPVSAAKGPASDQVILVVLDLTGDLDRIAFAKQALITQIGKLPRNAWVGLLKSQDGLHVLADPSADRKRTSEAIQATTISIAAGLLDTVEPALSVADAMLQSSPVRTAVLYITDGGISDYRNDYTNPVINESDPHDLSRRFPEALINDKISKLVASINKLQPPLFIVHLEDRTSRMNQAYQNGLKALAEATGGQIEVCRSNAEIPDAIAYMFRRISSSWSLTLALPAKVHDNAQVRVSAKQGDTETRLSWRERFVLPAQRKARRRR